MRPACSAAKQHQAGGKWCQTRGGSAAAAGTTRAGVTGDGVMLLMIDV
jgi:hypothetical protein